MTRAYIASDPAPHLTRALIIEALTTSPLRRHPELEEKVKLHPRWVASQVGWLKTHSFVEERWGRLHLTDAGREHVRLAGEFDRVFRGGAA